MGDRSCQAFVSSRDVELAVLEICHLYHLAMASPCLPTGSLCSCWFFSSIWPFMALVTEIPL